MEQERLKRLQAMEKLVYHLSASHSKIVFETIKNNLLPERPLVLLSIQLQIQLLSSKNVYEEVLIF